MDFGDNQHKAGRLAVKCGSSSPACCWKIGPDLRLLERRSRDCFPNNQGGSKEGKKQTLITERYGVMQFGAILKRVLSGKMKGMVAKHG